MLLLLAAVIAMTVIGSRGDLIEVRTARIERRALLESKVTANGEIRPVQFINLTAEVSGRVTDIFVKEGDQVTRGQPLLRVDPTQQASATSIQEAGLRASRAEAQNQMAAVTVAENSINNARAALNAAQADLARARVERNFAKIELMRNAELIEQGIVSRSVYDAAKMRFDVAVAAVKSAQARAEQARTQVRDAELRVAQSRAALRAAQARAEQAQASLRRESDLLSKTTQHSPIKGVIAHLPIQVGTFALANFQSTPLMIIADMSSINVEARVDEIEVTGVKVGQKVKVKVDAMGDRELDGEVAEIAASAVTRTGRTIAQTAAAGSQEAKDFKAVIRLTDLSEEMKDLLRPGMSATAIITTDRRNNVITIPLQALLEREPPREKPGADKAAKKKEPVEGVFIVRDDKAVFTPVETGITGQNEIEIISGLGAQQEIIIGPYRQLRTLKDGVVIRRENDRAQSRFP
ncbi:MAG: efflux RND transporter periplasmic adaptor subunit [Blastocatellia bacterium]